MTAIVSNYKNAIFSRDYSFDLPKQTQQIKRIAAAAIPFLSFYKPFCKPLSLIMGVSRLYHKGFEKDCLSTRIQLLIIVASIAGTIFKHPAGCIISTIHDLALQTKNLSKSKTLEEASTILIKIFNSLIYIALMSRGGLELSIASYAMQTCLSLVQSKDEFKKDRWIEGCSNLLMASIRINQSYTQYQQLKRNWEIEAAIKRLHVGKLHDKWQFPSDHLPIGVEVNGIKIISWNVLNNAYMDWIIEKGDGQGLNGSLITELNVPITADGLTLRDVYVADMVTNMMSKGHIVALQECSMPFLNHLQSKLPENWGLLKSFDQREDQDVILYNKRALEYHDDRSEISIDAYPSAEGKPLQNAFFFTPEEQAIRIINAHVPGDPNKPGREEFAKYVYESHNENCITVAVGDNNFERDEMIDAYFKAGFTDFSLHSPWKTNIDPYSQNSKGIDHILVVGDPKANSRDLKAEEFLAEGNLQEAIDLLNKEAQQTTKMCIKASCLEASVA